MDKNGMFWPGYCNVVRMQHPARRYAIDRSPAGGLGWDLRHPRQRLRRDERGASKETGPQDGRDFGQFVILIRVTIRPYRASVR